MDMSEDFAIMEKVGLENLRLILEVIADFSAFGDNLSIAVGDVRLDNRVRQAGISPKRIRDVLRGFHAIGLISLSDDARQIALLDALSWGEADSVLRFDQMTATLRAYGVFQEDEDDRVESSSSPPEQPETLLPSEMTDDTVPSAGIPAETPTLHEPFDVPAEPPMPEPINTTDDDAAAHIDEMTDDTVPSTGGLSESILHESPPAEPEPAEPEAEPAMVLDDNFVEAADPSTDETLESADQFAEPDIQVDPVSEDADPTVNRTPSRPPARGRGYGETQGGRRVVRPQVQAKSSDELLNALLAEGSGDNRPDSDVEVADVAAVDEQGFDQPTSNTEPEVEEDATRTSWGRQAPKTPRSRPASSTQPTQSEAPAESEAPASESQPTSRPAGGNRANRRPGAARSNSGRPPGASRVRRGGGNSGRRDSQGGSKTPAWMDRRQGLSRDAAADDPAQAVDSPGEASLPLRPDLNLDINQLRGLVEAINHRIDGLESAGLDADPSLRIQLETLLEQVNQQIVSSSTPDE
jgi:hypothetical protein